MTAKPIAGVSLTRQAGKSDADINIIMKRYLSGGRQTPPLVYGDLTLVPKTLQGAFDLVFKAESAFASLPASVRFRFRNQPSFLLNFLADPANKLEAIQLGLLPPEQSDPVEAAADLKVKVDELAEAKKALKRASSPVPKVPPEGA